MHEQQELRRQKRELLDGPDQHTARRAPISNRAMTNAQNAALPKSLRELGEENGTNLDRVRVFASSEHSEALATTTGTRIEVNPGADLDTPSGKRLLAHEAAHVIQQTGTAPGPPGSAGSAVLENRADQFANDVVAGRRPDPPGRTDRVVPQHQLGGLLDSGVDIDVYHPESLSNEERLQGIQQVIEASTGGLAGMTYATKMVLLTDLWHSFGNDVMEIARANGVLWSKSMDLGAQLADLPAFEGVRRQFKEDVKGLALRYMEGNLGSVQEEQAALGLRGDLARHGFAPDEPERRMEELQELAALVNQALEEREALKGIVVGYWMGGLPGLEEIGIEATFDPAGPPPIKPTGQEEPPIPTFESVKATWDEMTASLNQLTAGSPALHGMAHQDPEKLTTVVERDELAARDAVRQTLLALSEKIRETMEMVRTDDIDYRDLAPLHAQLFFGQVSMGSEYDWTDSWYRMIARDVLMDHKWNEFWLQIGLATLGAAAFMFAPLGGVVGTVAFGVGAGSGILQAGMSWENYVDLATAEAAETRAGSGIVAPGSADAALAAAVLDTLFAFLDVVPPVWKAAKGWRAGRQLQQAGRTAAIGADLVRLSVLPMEEATTAVLRGINEFGVAGAARTAGRTPAQLLGMVDPHSQVAAFLREHLERSLAGLPGTTALGEMSEKAATAAIRGGDPSVILSAIAEYGIPATLRRAGGWDNLTANLSDDMFVSQRLRMWRDQVFEDLQRVFGGPKAVVRTGSQTKIANDLDITLIGPNANADRIRAREFLAGRIGGTVDDIGWMLKGSLFVDPRRIHLYDMITSNEIRQEVAREAAQAERELMWGYALHQASGNPEMEALIREEIAAAGSDVRAYRPIGPRELAARGERADALHAKFLRQQAEGAAEEELAQTAKEAAINQTIINIAEREGYFSGAGVRTSVSEAESITAKGAAATTTEEMYNALADQSGKLLEQLGAMQRAAAPEDVANALRNMGKYGSRLAEVAGAADPRLVHVNLRGDAVWADLVEEWASIRKMIEERRAVFSPDYYGIPPEHVWSVDLPVKLQQMSHKAQWAMEETRRLHLDLIGELRTRDVFKMSPEAKEILLDTQKAYAKYVDLSAALQGVITHLITQEASEVDTSRFAY